MIVSHSHRFIFIKTRKVAGTSVELFLSQFCGEEDIVTTLGPDEKLREGMGARNYWVSGTRRGNRLVRGWWTLLGRPANGYRGFYPHMPAYEIRRLLGEETWNSYFKFTIERNPWDRQVSLYHWHYHDRDRKPSFDLFIRSPFHRKISRNFDTYAIGGKVAADYVCRYETLDVKPLKLQDYFLSNGILFNIPFLTGRRQIKKVLEETIKEEKDFLGENIG